jgi:predicted RecA/RadA family phage recombinase
VNRERFIRPSPAIDGLYPNLEEVQGLRSDGVVVGALFGVVSKTAAAGETVAIATTGVFDLPKLTSAVIAAGDKVSWDDTAKQVNVPGTGRYPIGTAIEAAVNGATIVRVRLDGVATAAA